MHRVQKILSNSGHCSRRKAEELIKEGRVRVNDKIISIGDKASDKDKIFVDGKLVKKERKIYLMFNKPQGCVTALKDNQYKTVMDYVNIGERVFPVGRLDYNTSGILLMTNDGDFANKVMHPRNEVKKTYFVMINKSIPYKDVRKIEQGIILEDGTKTSSAKVNRIEENILEISIHEGKKHIVKNIFKSLGYKVNYLERIKIGSLELKDVKPGRYRDLTKKEIEQVFD
ncbi:MAG: rRNA pseudouridine synthase [Nanoarchaeota archaeon]|nr:rRNA pseudouridine synthase [Nanoarchaeota archaeon]MBU1270544.1 rRNA pseudouridine synthase [Nanoarchaeota archaeon]MBU1605012.1 rRNA pseudouridine synthase [Nanoarchaeota archaeon]MBU2443436.1 rRNA pseudouridine synthase [Nanoarchaeota archaeon]